MEEYKKIEELNKLKENGVITEQEFETEKAKILKKQGMTKKQKNIVTWILTIGIIVGVIAGLCILADGMWTSSGTRATYNYNQSSQSNKQTNNYETATSLYAKIQNGMSYVEVATRLGTPFKTTSSASLISYYWLYENKIIMVNFLNDVVVSKSIHSTSN